MVTTTATTTAHVLRRVGSTAVPALAALVLLCAAPAARAEEPPALPVSDASVPLVHHAPVVAARVHEELRIVASIDHPELARSITLVYRTARDAIRAVPMLRAESGWVAILPAEDVLAPGLAYTIEVERVDGRRLSAFASREEMQPVQVMDDRMDQRERAAYTRLGSRRSVVTATGEYVGFGTTTGTQAIPCAKDQVGCPAGALRIPSVNDQFWRVEVGYTYRFLRTVAEFGLRLGVVRGTSLVQQSELDTSQYSVGLNYAAPTVRFRLLDLWHVELEGIASISEVGFSSGGGLQNIIGDPYGTRLTLGWESIGVTSATYFGTRFWTRLDIAVRDGFSVAPVVEVTDMPHAQAFGVRLYGDATLLLHNGFGIGVRAGYQARKSDSGGVGLGTTVSYGF
jgi:hypothetical protein